MRIETNKIKTKAKQTNEPKHIKQNNDVLFSPSSLAFSLAFSLSLSSPSLPTSDNVEENPESGQEGIQVPVHCHVPVSGGGVHAQRQMVSDRLKEGMAESYRVEQATGG